MSIISYFLRGSNIWRRRITRIICRPVRSFSNRYKLVIRSFFSNKLAVATLAIVISIALVGLIYYLFQLRNKFVVDLKFKSGWWKIAPVSVAILESAEQINYPSDSIKHSENGLDYDNEIHSYLGDDHGSSIIWKVDGFTKYAEELSDIQSLGPFETPHSGKVLKPRGFWVFSYGPSEKSHSNRDPNKELSPTSAIRVFKITEHLATTSNISPDNLEVAVALKAYVDGEAAVVIRYEDSLTKRFHLERIPQTGFKKEGFCYKILDVPFDKRIDMLYIRPTSTNLREDGLVIVDQIVIVVATRNTTESMMHTLVPTNWC